MSGLQMQVALGVMAFLASQGRRDYLELLGVSQDDFEKLTNNYPWLGSDRARVETVFFNVMDGTLHAIGLQPFEKPVEYVAAVIAVFVAPINVAVACRFVERPIPTEALARQANGVAGFTAAQLFAVVCDLVASPRCCAAKELFEKNTGIQLRKLQEGGRMQEVQTKK